MSIMESCIAKCTLPKRKNLPCMVIKEFKTSNAKAEFPFRKSKVFRISRDMEKIQRNAKQGNIYVERLKTIILYKTHQQWKQKTVLEDNEVP